MYSPSLLFINRLREKYVPDNLIFTKEGLNRNILEKHLSIK